MGNYDPKKDQVLDELHIGDDDDYLTITVAQYNGGEPKLRIVSRTFLNRHGEEKHARAGGLHREEVQQLTEKLNDEWLEKYFG